MRLQRLQAVARVLTIVAAAVAIAMAMVTAFTIGQFALVTALLAALLVRFQAPTEGWRHVGAVGLVLAVAAVVGVSGEPSSALLVTLLLVLAEYGVEHPTRWVVSVGLAAALLSAVAAIAVGGTTVASPAWVWPLVMVPLVGLAAGEIGGRQSLEGTAALMSANAALDEVLQLAERIPAGFDRWSVASAVQLEMLEASARPDHGATNPQLLMVQQGVLFGVGGPIARQPVGLLDEMPKQRFAQTWTKVETHDLPEPLAAQLEDGRWYLHRLGGDGTHGVVLVPHDVHSSGLDAIADVLRPAGVALANVDRFERLEDLAISAARVRVAHDLHDGVAQALTHVRFELDLLGLEHPDLTNDVERIRRVADAALLEVRRTVGELRESAPLRDRIERHVELLSSFAPATIDVDLPEQLEVPGDATDDLFRLVQEALSNAVRHAGANTIRVTVDLQPGTLAMAVVDDGAGIGRRAKRGVGLSGMESRVKRLGGDLVVRDRRGGGTVIEVEVPLAHGRDQSRQPNQPVSRS